MKNLLIAALLTAACATDDADVDSLQEEVFNGSPDPGDPGTVALWIGTQQACSGTLIGESLVLTAAHCVDQPWKVAGLSVRFGQDSAAPTMTRTASQVVLHPSYSISPLSHDIALLKLSTPVTTVPLVRLNRRPMSGFIGTSVRIVGYGMNEAWNPGGRQQGTATVFGPITGNGSWVGLNASPSFFGVGDSGGTTYLATDGIEVVSGVHSSSNGSTWSTDADVREYITSFIQPYILANDATAIDYDCSNIVSNEGWCDGDVLRKCDIVTGLPAAYDCGASNQGCGFIDYSWRGLPYYGCSNTTCEALGKNCGPVDDGYGIIMDCGTCEGYDTCGGGGEEGVCGCTWTCTCDYINTCGSEIECPIRCPPGGGEP